MNTYQERIAGILRDRYVHHPRLELIVKIADTAVACEQANLQGNTRAHARWLCQYRRLCTRLGFDPLDV